MDFVQFCRSMGVRMDYLPPMGRWIRYATDDKPHHKNASVKYMGEIGFVKDWRGMEDTAVWFPDGFVEAKRAQILRKAHDDSERLASEAAQKATRMAEECHAATHPYLERKGFPDLVWKATEDGRLFVPMFNRERLVGAQLIDADGKKKFIYGQRSGGAELPLGSRGVRLICEGFATGLSVQAALRNLKVSYVVHVAFSAGNMKKIAQRISDGVVVADNDESGTGERVAREIGWPFWMSDVVGEDFNDAHKRLGIFKVAMQLKEVMRRRG